MKTENISQGSTLLRQSKLARDDKLPDKKVQDALIEEKVDLSTKTSTLTTNSSPTYQEVLELLDNTDFSHLRDIDWISREGQTSLQALL